MRVKQIADRAAGYGIRGQTVDGNEVLAVYQAARAAVAECRSGRGPVLLELLTYRRPATPAGSPLITSLRKSASRGPGATRSTVMGMRPIVDVQYGDFLFLAMDQIVNSAAKLRYMSGGTVQVPLSHRGRAALAPSPADARRPHGRDARLAARDST